MFTKDRILFEDNHIMVVNKLSGELVQSDTEGNLGLEDDIKEFIKIRDTKPGAVFLGVIHRIDRPVSGAVIFAKTSKALARMNENVKNRDIKKHYLAITERSPQEESGTLRHYIVRNSQKNRSYALDRPAQGGKEGILNYSLIGASQNYYLLDIELITGRHHQIRSQLQKIGCSIRGDLKYGASRSNSDGSISLHSRSLEFEHPVSKEKIKVVAPTPNEDNLWRFFEQTTNDK